jgi:hypothetical protein
MYLDVAQGQLPTSLASLSSLQQFVFTDNLLTGSLPAFVGGYPGVGEAWLERNSLSGSLPQSVCSSPSGQDNIHLQVPGHFAWLVITLLSATPFCCIEAAMFAAELEADKFMNCLCRTIQACVDTFLTACCLGYPH